MADLVLDAGALINMERKDAKTMAWIAEASRRKSALLVAGATYAEIWHGHRNGAGTLMSIALKGTVPVATTESIGRRAGEIIAEAGAPKKLRFDAIVIATAESRKADVLTDDPNDMLLLAPYGGVQVRVAK